MRFITVSDLSHGATKIISTLESNREEVAVTKKGKPIALLRLISDSDFGSKNVPGTDSKEVGKKKKKGR